MRALVWVALLAGCLKQQVDAPGIDHAAGAPPAFGARLHLLPGERGHYRLHLHDVLIGTVDLQVSEVKDGRARISTLIESDGVLDLFVHLRDEVSTVVDLATARPVATRGSFVNLLTGGDAPEPEVDDPWPYPDHNGHSLLFTLRGWDAAAGARATTPLRSRGKPHTTDLWMVGAEMLETDLGPLPAVRIEGSIAEGSSEGAPFHFVLWCADDETRVILRLDTDTDVDQIASARIAAYAVE